jgi:hypothetical protein
MVEMWPKAMAETKCRPKPPQAYVSAGSPAGGRNRSVSARPTWTECSPIGYGSTIVSEIAKLNFYGIRIHAAQRLVYDL